MQKLIRSDHHDIQEQITETDVMNLSRHGTTRPSRDTKLLCADARHELTKPALTTSTTATETLNLNVALQRTHKMTQELSTATNTTAVARRQQDGPPDVGEEADAVDRLTYVETQGPQNSWNTEIHV